MAGRIWWTVAISAIVAFIIMIIIVAIGTFSMYKVVKSSTDDIVTILENTTKELGKVSNQLSSLNQLNSHLSGIETGIGSINRRIDDVLLQTSKIEPIESNLGNISNSLLLLERKYPPSQNFFIQDITNENLSNALNAVFEPQINTINNKVKNLSFNFYWTLFNSLFSISILGLSLYIIFIFKRKSS